MWHTAVLPVIPLPDMGGQRTGTVGRRETGGVKAKRRNWSSRKSMADT